MQFEGLRRLPLDEIYERLTHFGFNAGYDYPRVWGWYRAFKATGIYPFAGGYADQPEDVMQDFGTFDLLMMERTYPATPASAGVKPEDLKDPSTNTQDAQESLSSSE